MNDIVVVSFEKRSATQEPTNPARRPSAGALVDGGVYPASGPLRLLLVSQVYRRSFVVAVIPGRNRSLNVSASYR